MEIVGGEASGKYLDRKSGKLQTSSFDPKFTVKLTGEETQHRTMTTLGTVSARCFAGIAATYALYALVAANLENARHLRKCCIAVSLLKLL